MTRNRSLTAVLWVVWLAAAAFGGIGLVERLTMGHALANYTSYVPWGLWVAAYIYFIGLSAGSFLLSSLVYVFGVKRLEGIAKLSLYVAVVTLVLALLTILFDLGHMARFYEVYTRPNFHSMMAWMVWLYTAYFFLLIAELVLATRSERSGRAEIAVRRDRTWLRILGSIGVPLAIAFHGGVGALFGTVLARELWHSPMYPILFLSGALLSGGALMAGIVALFWPRRDEGWRDTLRLLGNIVLGLILLDTLFEWAEYSIAMWYGVGAAVGQLRYMLFGPYWYVFWIVHVLFGVVVPIGLLLGWRKPAGAALASALVVVTFIGVRLDLVIPGLVTPELAGLETAYLSHRLSFNYLPSLFEWQVFVGVVALGVALFYLGYRFLPLVPRVRKGVQA